MRFKTLLQINQHVIPIDNIAYIEDLPSIDTLRVYFNYKIEAVDIRVEKKDREQVFKEWDDMTAQRISDTVMNAIMVHEMSDPDDVVH